MSPINDVKLVVMIYCVVLTVRVYGPGIFSYGPGIFSHVITGGFPRSHTHARVRIPLILLMRTSKVPTCRFTHEIGTGTTTQSYRQRTGSVYKHI